MSKVLVPKQVVAKFLRAKDGKTPIGLVCATKGSDGSVVVGWSFVAKADRKPGNTKNRAWQITLARCAGGSGCELPRIMVPVVNEISERAKKYFKVDEVLVVGA